MRNERGMRDDEPVVVPSPGVSRDISINIDDLLGSGETDENSTEDDYFDEYFDMGDMGGDSDRDGQIEIIVRLFDSELIDPLYRGRLVSYNMDNSINWISNEKYFSDILSRNSESLALADFNKDGIPEVYLFNEIYNALTGVKILDGGDNGKGFNLLYGKSIAAELDGDDNSLELAAGYTIYQVDITNIIT